MTAPTPTHESTNEETDTQQVLMDVRDRVLGRTAKFAAGGAVWGVVLATLRNASVGIYGLSMGINFGLVTVTYQTCLEGLCYSKGHDGASANQADMMMAGLLTGTGWMTVFTGPRGGIKGGLAFSAAAAAAYAADQQLQKWKRSMANEYVGKK